MARVKLPFRKLPSHLAPFILSWRTTSLTAIHHWHSTMVPFDVQSENLPVGSTTVPDSTRWWRACTRGSLQDGGRRKSKRHRPLGQHWDGAVLWHLSYVWASCPYTVLSSRRLLSHTTIMGPDVSEAGFCFHAASIPHLGGPKRMEAPNSVRSILLNRNWLASWRVSGAQEIIPHLPSKLFCDGNKTEMFIL